MHLFYDSTLNTWRLITEKLPEKPTPIKHAGFIEDWAYEELLKRYNAAIAALKQSALTVGNKKIITEYHLEVGSWDRVLSGELYFWPGGYETRYLNHNGIPVSHKQYVLEGDADTIYQAITVAILTLPEEKNNTMENMIQIHCPTTGKICSLTGCFINNHTTRCSLSPNHLTTASGSVAAPKEEEIVISLSDFTDDKGFKVYDPEPSAKRLLTKHSPLVVVKGLLNQLTACRQTAEIGKEWSAHCCVMYQQENVSLNELIKEMVALFDVVRSDLIEIHNDSPTGWTIIKLNNIIEKGQALLDKQ